MIAQKLGLPQKSIDLIELCSPMHDLGKIAIPDKILQKQGKLTDEEWKVMKTHSLIGAELLKPLSYKLLKSSKNEEDNEIDSDILKMARVITTYHHEHWDGSGYPHGLKGDKIPIEARIVTIADIYDAISSKRPYKIAFSEKRCQQVIKESSGTILDPKIVDIFFNNIDDILSIKSRWKD